MVFGLYVSGFQGVESNNWAVLLRFITYHISIRYMLESGGFQVKAVQANMDGVGMQLEGLQAFSERGYMYRATVSSVQFHVYIYHIG